MHECPFDTERFSLQGLYQSWEPWLVLLWAGADLLIFIAFMLIPMALLAVLRRRPDIRHRGLVSLFAGFMLLFGVTHALSIAAIWAPIYPLMGAVKMAAGLMSLAAAFMLFRMIPTFLRIPTPDLHEDVIEKLRETLQDLTRARDELEERVEQRTGELHNANLRLTYIAREAVQRSRKLIQVVSSLTQPGVDASRDPVVFLRDLRGRINALTIATSTVMEQEECASARLIRIIRRQIDPLFSDPSTQLQVDGPPIDVGAQGAQQISLAVWELASRHVQSRARAADVPFISVHWQITAQDDGSAWIELEWREVNAETAGLYGLGDEDFDKFRAVELSEFGETLLTRIVPKMLGGKGQVEALADAFAYRLECPLTSLTDLGECEVSRTLTNSAIEREMLAWV